MGHVGAVDLGLPAVFGECGFEFFGELLVVFDSAGSVGVAEDTGELFFRVSESLVGVIGSSSSSSSVSSASLE